MSMTDEEKEAYLNTMRPIRIADFKSVFHTLIEQPIKEYVYDAVDYAKNYMTTLPSLEYKTDKMKEFIYDDYHALHNYVMAQPLVTNKYEFLAENALLDERLKTNPIINGNEVPGNYYVFEISRPNPYTKLNSRIFVDGKFVPDFLYDRREYVDLLYVPENRVPEDVTYFEIEVFPSLIESTKKKFTSEDQSVIIEWGSEEFAHPTLSDIYMYYSDQDNADRISLDNFKFELISEDYDYYTDSSETTTDNLLEIQKDQAYIGYDQVVAGSTTIDRNNTGVNFTSLNMKMKITAMTPDVLGREIVIAVSKMPVYVSTIATRTGYPVINIQTGNTELVKEYTRVFQDGVLLPRNRYDFRNFHGQLQVRCLEQLEKRSTLAIDITPYRNRLIFYKEELDSDMIDLNGYIDKPFDMNYYDVYMNGIKLNRFNVFPISPTEIKFAGLRSLYNLEIYERDRDWEYFNIKFENYFTLSDFIKRTFMEKKVKEKLIHDVTGDTLPNNLVDDKMNWERDDDGLSLYITIFYYERLIELGLANPDTLQFELADIMENFTVIDDLYRIQNDKGEAVYLLDPDLYYESEDSKKDKWRVFLTGNLSSEEFE